MCSETLAIVPDCRLRLLDFWVCGTAVPVTLFAKHDNKDGFIADSVVSVCAEAGSIVVTSNVASSVLSFLLLSLSLFRFESLGKKLSH
jgi:hypothetical protein